MTHTRTAEQKVSRRDGDIAHRERRNAGKRALYAADPEKMRAANRSSYLRHQEKRKQYARDQYWANPERSKAYGRQYHQQHKEQQNAYTRAWSKAQALRSWVVYVWFADDGSPDYVGRGTKRRPMSHKKTASWWTPGHFLISMTCDSEWQAMEMEGRWGGLYQPRQNKEGYRHAE